MDLLSMGCGSGGCRSPCFPARGETERDRASTASFCWWGRRPFAAGLHQPQCRSLGCALCSPCWAPSTPLNQSGPLQQPRVHPRLATASLCFQALDREKTPLPEPVSKEKKAVFSECKHWHTGEGYRKQINKNTGQTNNTFIHLRLLQRFVFVLYYGTGRISCFTAQGQFRYGLCCTQSTADCYGWTGPKQIICLLRMSMPLPAEDSTFNPRDRPVSHKILHYNSEFSTGD